MALSDVLSALRELVLGQVVLPRSRAERRTVLRARFPRLAEAELISLEKVEPERIAIYTGTIISGEVSTLTRHFPVTFALLERHWREAFGAPFDESSFVQEMQRNHPWRGYTTDLLCESLREYIDADLAPLTDLEPALLDIARLEHLTLQVARAPRLSETMTDVLSLEELTTLTVSDVLDLHFKLDRGAALEKFSFDVVDYRVKFYENDRILPKEPAAKRPIWAICGRSGELVTRWIYLREAVFSLFLEAAPEGAVLVADLAAASLSEDSESCSEIEQFQSFFNVIRALVETGAGTLHRAAR